MTTRCDLLHEWITIAESRSPMGLADRIEFWNRELRRTWSFLMDHKECYLAYLDKNAQGVNNPLEELIAVGMAYFEYAQGKLGQFRTLRQSRYLLRV